MSNRAEFGLEVMKNDIEEGILEVVLQFLFELNPGKLLR